ncbi:MAG: hypothetical protein QM744_11535 [Mesorhizobium sp.]
MQALLAKLVGDAKTYHALAMRQFDAQKYADAERSIRFALSMKSERRSLC